MRSTSASTNYVSQPAGALIKYFRYVNKIIKRNIHNPSHHPNSLCISDLHHVIVFLWELIRSSGLVAQAETSAEGMLHDTVSNRLRAESMLKPYLLDMLDVPVSLVALPLLKARSGSHTPSVLIPCLAPKGLLRKRKNLRYPFLASGVRPKRAKNTKAKKGLSHSSQYTETTPHFDVDHALVGASNGSQSEWTNVQPW